MSAHAYPHIVFATDADTLPRADLEALVTDLFADRGPLVTHGPLQVEVRLGDYTFTFWYDDDADGLGERYAEYAPPLKKRRVGRCTTMIDLSGAADPSGAHADEARRLTTALADRAGVYVFSEDTKSFVGLDEHDPFADAPLPEPGVEDDDIPPLAPTAPASAPPTAAERSPSAPEPAAAYRDDAWRDEKTGTADATYGTDGTGTDASPRPTQPAASDRRDDVDDIGAFAPPSTPDEVEPADAAVPQHETPDDRPEAPAEPEAEGGFFKRLFGRGRR